MPSAAISSAVKGAEETDIGHSNKK